MQGNRNAGDALAQNLQSTAAAYDALPYDDTPIFRTHPSRMAAVARLFGIDAAPAAQARVLELGCAAGANIIPLAYFYPEAQFIGIELSRAQVEDGQRRIEQLGLTNIELRCESITDFDTGAGQFDYIVCHGVYSWVPAEVRAHILRICGAMLSPNGIAYISYNVLPGWRIYQPIRDALRLMVPPDADAATRAAMGRGLVTLMGEKTPDTGAYGALLREGFEMLSRYSNSYLFHEYMEPVNDPMVFGEFVDEAGRYGLSYLAESELRMMFAEAHGGDFSGMLDKVTDDNIVSHQQMLDILTGQTFRTSMLVRSDGAERIQRKVRPEVLAQLHFMASPGFTFARTQQGYSITSRSGDERIFDEALLVQVLDNLLSGRPGTNDFAACMEGVDEDMVPVAAKLIWDMLITGMLSASTEALRCGELTDSNPVATRMARLDAASGRPITASRTHHGVGFGDMPAFLVAQLDGSKDRKALAGVIAREMAAGEVKLDPAAAQNGQEPTVEQALEKALETIASYGLLE